MRAKGLQEVVEMCGMKQVTIDLLYSCVIRLSNNIDIYQTARKTSPFRAGI